MNEQCTPSNLSILPAKRRRGRPRKDGGIPKRGVCPSPPATPMPETVKKAQTVEANQTENAVGQVVSGVIDGCFDAGYFLTVRVGNSNTLLRGVVFQPGRFAPVSASNDVAPQAKMYHRRDIPIPIPIPSLQVQNDPQSKPASSDTFVINNHMVPQSGPFSLQMTEASRGASGFPNITVHQSHDQRFQIQSLPDHRPENLRTVEHDDVMQVFEVSPQPQVPKVGEDGILPSEGTSNQALESMTQPCFMAYNLEQSHSRLPQNPTADVESKMEKSQFDSGPNHEHETRIDSQPKSVQEMECGPSEAPAVAELQFISKEPEAAEYEVKQSDPGHNNEQKSPKLGTTQTPQAPEVMQGSPKLEFHNRNTQNVEPELINDPMGFVMEKATSPKNNEHQDSSKGKPMSDHDVNVIRGPEFSLENTGEILTLGIGGGSSNNPGRMEAPFYNPTDFGFVLGDFVPPTGESHGNPNNLPPETQHR